ncbi:MAG: DUF2085 domain-containing protein [Bacteroidota bacterium]|nr:DUF2085 domain-containing protein [Bacteroidota bacterium]
MIAAGAVLWCASFAAASVLSALHAHPAAVAAARLFFAPVCHQDPARSFMLFGVPLSVCNRCAGVYIAFTLTFLSFPLVERFSGRVNLSACAFGALLLPMLLDYALDVAGVFSNSAMTRAGSGALAGVGLAIFFYRAIGTFTPASIRSLFTRQPLTSAPRPPS